MHHPKSIEEIVSQQSKLWNLREELAKGEGRERSREFVHLPEGPWISVSRQLAFRGDELALRLAGRLDWRIFDSEIISAIAHEVHTSERILTEIDEHAVGTFNSMIDHMLVPGVPSQREFIASLMKIVWGLARKGNAIIIGRGANWFLDQRYGLRLRIIAPFDKRVARLAQLTKLGEGEAAEEIRRVDKERAAVARMAFGRDLDDPLGYDLVVNMAGVSMDTAVETALASLRNKLHAHA